MRRRHSLVLILPLLAACVGPGGPDATAPLRFATALDHADEAVDGVIARMDGFERLAMREDAAIAFAAGGRGAPPARFTAPPAGAAEAAGRAISPAFAALADYGHVLALAAGGQPVAATPGVSGEALAAAAAQGLRAVQEASGTPVLEPVRTAGLAGITALADLPAAVAQRRTAPTLEALVAEGQPHVTAIAALLRAVIGPEPGQGTRGAIRARREALDAQQARFLAALRADSRIGAGERYAIFRSVAELRDTDPAQGNFTAIIDLLAALEAAHGALAAGGPEGEAKVTAFEAAVARLTALSAGSRRG